MKSAIACILVLAAGTVLAEPLPGDIDGNGEVNFSDFLILSENFGRRGEPAARTISAFRNQDGLPQQFMGWWGLEEANDWLDGFGEVDLVGRYPSGALFVTPTHLHYDVRLGYWEGHYWESVPYTYDSQTGTITLAVDGERERWTIEMTSDRDGWEEFFFTKERKQGGRVIRRVTIMWDRERDHRKPDFWTRDITGAYTKPVADGFIPAAIEPAVRP